MIHCLCSTTISSSIGIIEGLSALHDLRKPSTCLLSQLYRSVKAKKEAKPLSPKVKNVAPTASEPALRRSTRNRKPSATDSVDESILAGNVPTTRQQRSTRKTSQSSEASVEPVNAAQGLTVPNTPRRRGRPRKTSQSSETSEPATVTTVSTAVSATTVTHVTDQLPVIMEKVSSDTQLPETTTSTRRLRPRKTSTSSNPPASEVGDVQPLTPRRGRQANMPVNPDDVEQPEAPTTPTRRGRPRKTPQSKTKQSTTTSKNRGSSVDTAAVTADTANGKNHIWCYYCLPFSSICITDLSIYKL